LAFELRESGLGWVKYLLLGVVILAALYLLIFYTIVPLRRHIESSADSRQYMAPAPKDEKEDQPGRLPLPRRESQEGEPGRREAGIPLASVGTHGRSGKVPLTSVGGKESQGKVPLMQSGEDGAPAGGRGKIPLSQISSSRLAGSHSVHGVQKLGHRPIEFRLGGQNPFNGGRNIRWIGKNSRSVGGGSSFFLIFLVKVPERIAEVSFTEKGLRFTPIRDEFFPDFFGPIENCINRPIELVTDQGSFTMVFREWISPLERINQVLHLTDEPGLQEFDY